MFDISFSELVVIMVVALIVIGPERLPKVARTAGHLWARLQRSLQNVKNEIANDIAIEEARQLRGTIKEEISSVEKSLQQARMELEEKILLAQQGKSLDESGEQAPPGTKPSTTPPSTTPDKPV